jgi:hypothetical protein
MLCTNASTAFYTTAKLSSAMSEETPWKPTYVILTPRLRVGIAQDFAEHMDVWIEHCLDEQIKALESERLGMQRNEEGTLHYECDLGFVLVESVPDYGKRLTVARDTTQPDSEYAAGRLALALLEAIERKFFTEPYATMVKYCGTGWVRAISDLVEVSVDARMGRERRTVAKYAIPLHYANRTLIPESEEKILALENEVVASLRCPGHRATVRTRVAKRWDAHRGILAGFFPTEEKAEYARTRLYHSTRIIVPDVAHAGTDPQSGAGQSQ